MQIKFSSVLVDDQAKALKFYTQVLGFKKVTDLPLGEYRWLTVSSPEGVEGLELLLEPMGFEPAKDYQKALYEAGIPITVFLTQDIEAEHARLKKKGVTFRGEVMHMGQTKTVMFEDTCGNLINLTQVMDQPT